MGCIQMVRSADRSRSRNRGELKRKFAVESDNFKKFIPLPESIHAQSVDIDLCIRLLSSDLHSSFNTLGHSIVAVAMVTRYNGHLFVRFRIGSCVDSSITCDQSFAYIGRCHCRSSFPISHRVYVVFLPRSGITSSGSISYITTKSKCG